MNFILGKSIGENERLVDAVEVLGRADDVLTMTYEALQRNRASPSS